MELSVTVENLFFDLMSCVAQLFLVFADVYVTYKVLLVFLSVVFVLLLGMVDSDWQLE